MPIKVLFLSTPNVFLPYFKSMHTASSVCAEDERKPKREQHTFNVNVDTHVGTQTHSCSEDD